MICNYADVGRSSTAKLRQLLKENQLIPVLDSAPERKAMEWLDAMDQALTQAEANADALMDGYTQSAIRAERFAMEMALKFLYSPQRRVFHLGFNLDTGQLDNNYYDLLASEARIASIISLAKGEVPQSHWLQLSRPITRVEGTYVLLSWSATMFESLLPTLFLRSYPGTLLADSAQGAVPHQIAYGKAKGVPWGISESGFYLFDANQNYQYRAFGVPGLGFKRGLGDDLVVAPYASALALTVMPREACRNLQALAAKGFVGSYGFFEAVDYTPSRVPLGKNHTIVRTFMAHHQGMSLLAFEHVLLDRPMQRRFMSDPQAQATKLLLQERVPKKGGTLHPH